MQTELGRKRPSCLVWVTGIPSKDWPSSLGERVHKYENRAKLALIAAYVTVLYVPSAIASEMHTTDGSTVVAANVVVDPLDKYRGATKLDDQELKELLQLVGFEGKSLKVAWAIAKKESNGRPLAHNNNLKTGDNSYGIFQINMIGDLGLDRRKKFDIIRNVDLFDPVTNAKAAFYMTAKGTDFGSWGYGPNAYDGTPEEPKITEWVLKFPS